MAIGSWSSLTGTFLQRVLPVGD